MKLFRILLVVLLFFFVSCEGNGGTRLIPVDDEAEKSDTGDTEGDTGDTEGDTGDTTGDTGDTEGDTGDTTGDTGDTTGDTGSDTDSDTDTDADTDSDTDTDTGSDDPNTRESDCTGLPANNAVWNTASKITQTFDGEKWEPSTEAVYSEEASDTECRFKCEDGYKWNGSECYRCSSAVFNGTSSKIEVADNDLLNLGTEWTIETWIKQDQNDAADTSDNAASIIRKSAEETPAYELTGFYKRTSKGKTYYGAKGSFDYQYQRYGQPKSDSLEVAKEDLSSVQSDWTHIALEMKESDGKQYLIIYVNGARAYKAASNNVTGANSVAGALTIGANLYEKAGGFGGYGAVSPKYFKGMIDSIKISNKALYSGETMTPTPSKLTADDSTVALWDFSGNADDSINGLEGVATDVEYSTECKEW